MHGAEDGPSFIPRLISHEGLSGLRCGPQGAKIGALEIGPLRLLPVLTPALTATIATPPRAVPTSIIAIGTFALAALPGEFTTVAGRRIRSTILKAAIATKLSDVALVGLANGYALYVATPEEYALQHDEGSQTLYGAAEEPMFVERFGMLAEHLGDASPDRGGEYAHQHVARHFFGLPRKDPSRGCDEGTRYAFTPDSSDLGFARLPSACWEDVAPVLGPSPRPVVPSISVEIEEQPGRWQSLLIDGNPESDDGLRIVTLGSRDGASDSYWCSYWIPPATIDPVRHYRFAVALLTGRRIVRTLDLQSTAAPTPCPPRVR